MYRPSFLVRREGFFERPVSDAEQSKVSLFSSKRYQPALLAAFSVHFGLCIHPSRSTIPPGWLRVYLEHVMYIKSQLERLFSLIDKLNTSSSTDGCSEDLAVVDGVHLEGLVAEARRLKESNNDLMVGRHTHLHGESTYAFLVEDGTELSLEGFEQHLQEAFEPEREETLSLSSIGTPVLISSTEAVRKKHAVLLAQAAKMNVVEDSDQPGMFVWSGAETSHDTKDGAEQAVALEVTRETMAYHDLSQQFWDSLAIEHKLELVHEAYDSAR